MVVRKINIAFLIGSLGRGGAENQAVLIINQLNSEKYNKHIVVLWDKEDGFKNRLNQDVKYYSVQYRRRTLPLGMIKIIKYLKKNSIDILHTHMYDPNKIGAIAGKLARIPTIVTHEHGKNPWKRHRHYLVEKYLIDSIAAKRFAVSKDILNRRIKLDRSDPKKIINIPNGVEIPDFIFDSEPTPKIIGSMGRLVEAKDFTTLFKSIKMVKDLGYKVELHVAGAGPLRETLKKQARKLGINRSIKLLGFQKSEDFLEKIDLFAMSSIGEGMPVALLEAMSYGLPIVATNVGGISEIVENGKDGLLCDPRNHKSLAENITKIIENKELRNNLSKNARQKINNKYNIKIIAQQFDKCYISLMSNNARINKK